ncbi:hypothetical protein DPMN_094421 [Dreissena polymorpha]|uniref:Uncharacterized protein n=1 Tax=Dreissena polymorpha TaxID=45954 RepID=A0A9D4L603_DREPO|nr:hypothetical protein DPMN_094421 [Dreissena polymorpha]
MKIGHEILNPGVIWTNLLTKKTAPPTVSQTQIDSVSNSIEFHENRKINVASRVLTRKNAAPSGSHVFKPTGIIFELVQDIIGMNLLTKFHVDWTVNVASREKCPAPWQPFFSSHFHFTIFILIQDIIGTNILTKFHEDRTMNVASREKCPAPGGHVFETTKTIFELIQDIIGTNLLTKFHEDRRNKCGLKNSPPPGDHVFQPTGIVFELVHDIIGMNLLTKFHEDPTITVASRMKNAPPLGGHVFQANITIFEVIQDIIGKNFLSKFHEDWTINVASIENASPPCGHVFKATKTILELVQDIIGKNFLTKFHEDGKINVASRVLTMKNAPTLGDIVGMNLLTKLNEYLTINVALLVKNAPPLDQSNDQIAKRLEINVASRVLTRKNVPTPGGHVFKANVTIFKLIQDIIETNLLTKFHEDWTINVASRVLTRQMLTPHDGQKAITKAHHE